MDLQTRVLSLLDNALALDGRAASFTADTPLLGALPELDSIGVVSFLAELEDQLGLTIDDDAIDASLFATVGSVVDYLRPRVAV